MDNRKIKQLIEQKLPHANVTVDGSEGKYQATVISPRFNGLSTLERHQMVYAAVDSEIKSGALHALSIIAKTPDER